MTVQGMVCVPAGTREVDPAHSSSAFEVKHMMIVTVRGRFREFGGRLDAAEEYPANSLVSARANVASIDTGSAQRDAHLRLAEFFDAERCPEIRFASTRIQHVEGGDYRVSGELTIKDVTREVEMTGTVEGAAEDPWGNERVGISVRGTIDRTDFGLTWQQRLQDGGLLVGEKVSIADEGVDLDLAVVAEDLRDRLARDRLGLDAVLADDMVEVASRPWRDRGLRSGVHDHAGLDDGEHAQSGTGPARESVRAAKRLATLLGVDERDADRPHTAAVGIPGGVHDRDRAPRAMDQALAGRTEHAFARGSAADAQQPRLVVLGGLVQRTGGRIPGQQEHFGADALGLELGPDLAQFVRRVRDEVVVGLGERVGKRLPG